MKKNTLSPHDFTFWTIYGAVMLSFVYRRFYALSYIGIGDTLLQIAVTIILWLFLIHNSRNYSSIMLVILLPLIILETKEYWEYVSIIPAMTRVAIISALALGVTMAKRNARRIRVKQWKKVVFKRSFIKTFGWTVCLIMLAGVVYGRSVHVRQLSVLIRNVMADYEFDNTGNDENTLANNIETLSKLDPRGRWNSLTLEEKSDVLETVIRVECRYLGMQDTLPKLNIAYTEREELLGFYDREEDTITLSYDYLMKTRANGYSCCQVLCHELYHRYQNILIEMLEKLESSEATEKYSNLLLLYDTTVYRKEAVYYIDGKDDFGLYASQQLERDAERYGNEAVTDYYEANQEYFEKQDQAGKNKQ